MRTLFLALALLCAAPAFAQPTPAASPEVRRASQALGAIWRPVSGPPSDEAVQTACAGAVEEMGAVEAALPPELTPESLARVRALRGLLIVPTDYDPATAYFFPSRDLAWFTSGLGGISVISEGEGFIAVQDAGGRQIVLQLGRAGGRPVLRLRAPDGAILNFVGCASTVR